VSLPARVGLAAAVGSGATALLVPVAGVAVGSAPDGATAQAPPATPGFALLDARVSPRLAYVAGRRVQVSFGIDAPAPLALRVEVVREATRTLVLSIALPAAAPGSAQGVEWDGRTRAGAVAPNGRYRFRVVAADGSARNAGSAELRSHAYPIRGRHADRGPIGAFGVGRNGGRRHEGFDVNAACGTPVVAARGGVVVRAGYDPVLYGNIVIVRGAHTRRDYWYAHLLRTPRLRAGDRVGTGQRIGSIGATGNARTIGCHLHFEIRSRATPIDPGPELHAWDRWS
jgi:murein DD-endopeptidase MepM/ murein hydrolase activator NlpD